MSSLLDVVWMGFKDAFLMAYEVWWALVFGFAISAVVQAQRLFGDPDYLLRVLTQDIASYQRLEDDQLAMLPGVQRLTSTIVMKQVVEHRPLTT